MDWEKNVSLASFSTLGIGGKAKYFKVISTVQEAQDALIFCFQHQLPYFILGKGSNTLFDDRGFNGAVLFNKIQFLERKESLFTVGAGYSFSLLGLKTAKAAFTGLEYAAGIPATVGGAVYMNAGASGQQVSDTLAYVEFIHENGDSAFITRSDMNFSYRKSIFQHMKGMIVSASFQLQKQSSVRQRQLKLLTKRNVSQPIRVQSAGCTFRNSDKVSAGLLIDRLGLKGLTIGDAQVSEKHANFIINKGRATAKDMMQLISQIQDKAKTQAGIDLQMEVNYVPFTGEK